MSTAVAQILGRLSTSFDRSAAHLFAIPQTPDELHTWVHEHLNVWIPRERVCENHCAPFDAFAAAFFATEPVAVWHASRGFGGKSFVLGALGLTEAILLGSSLRILGGSFEQSENVHRYLSGTHENAYGRFWDAANAPRGLLLTDPTKTEMRLSNGGYVKALTASSRSVRGPHPQRIRMDEIDEMDLIILDAAMGQTMEARGITPHTVLSSTWHYPDGTMTEILKRSRDKGWPVYQWCYRENLAPHGWLPQSEIDRKRAEVTSVMWDIEYELQEPSPELRAIDPDMVRHLFRWERPGKWDSKSFRGEVGKQVRTIEPFHLRRFYHGADWAKKQDWTILHTNERTPDDEPDRLACWVRLGRKPWPLMTDDANDRLREYGGPMIHDSTGVGQVVHDLLDESAVGFDFTARKETHKMLSDYIASIERGDRLLYPMIEYAFTEHLHATVDAVYGSDHLPDSLAAGALAWYCREHAPYYEPGAMRPYQR